MKSSRVEQKLVTQSDKFFLPFFLSFFLFTRNESGSKLVAAWSFLRAASKLYFIVTPWPELNHLHDRKPAEHVLRVFPVRRLPLRAPHPSWLFTRRVYSLAAAAAPKKNVAQLSLSLFLSFLFTIMKNNHPLIEILWFALLDDSTDRWNNWMINDLSKV